MRRILATLVLVCPFLFNSALDAQSRDAWIYSGDDTWDSAWNRRSLPRIGAIVFVLSGASGWIICHKNLETISPRSGCLAEPV